MTPQQQRTLARVGSDCDQTLAAAKEFLIDCWARGCGREAMQTFDLASEMAASPDPMVKAIGKFAGLGLIVALQQALPVVWGGPQHGE